MLKIAASIYNPDLYKEAFNVLVLVLVKIEVDRFFCQ